MAREMIPCIDGGESPTLHHFRCSNCGWSYSPQDPKCHYEESLADARELFQGHDCALYHNHDESQGLAADDARYRNADGFIVMCAHCKRTRRATGAPTWDWVPQYLDSTLPGTKVSHGLCEQCSACLYPETTTALQRAKVQLWLQALREGAAHSGSR